MFKIGDNFCNTQQHYFSASSIQALLSAPNPDDPLSENIAKHWKSNEAEAVETGTLLSPFLISNGNMYLLWCQIQPLDNQECSFVGDVAAKEWTRLYASGA